MTTTDLLGRIECANKTALGCCESDTSTDGDKNRTWDPFRIETFCQVHFEKKLSSDSRRDRELCSK